MNHGTTGYRNGCRCRACRDAAAAYVRSQYRKDPIKAYGQKYRRTYGITTEQRDAAQAAQGDVCKICRKPFKEQRGKNGPQTDHNHKTDVFRGILCVCCNRSLGLMKEDTAAMGRAIEYVETDGRFDRYAPGIGEGLL